jgi:hypothetical protein
LAAAVGFVLLEPWHGPTVLTLSEQHGVDAADLPALPLMALALAVAPAPPRGAQARPSARAAGAALVVGALLLAGVLFPRGGGPLVPAGGGTFGGATQHVDGVRSTPVGRWTHVAVTYDGSTYRLYVNGDQVSTHSASGAVLSTSDPLWIGGNQPYGEYFRGVIDEVRVYRRALARPALRAAMSSPVDGGRGSADLATAYAFDGGRTATDASGHGNTGALERARWTRAGRFGGGVRFDADGEVIRVPASASLDLRTGMTLMAWIKPSELQAGWRTVLARQTDAYFLAAGGGREDARRLELLDRLRFVLLILLTGWLTFALLRGDAAWVRRRRWYVPLALFVAGSLADLAFAPTDTLIGPALAALGVGATSAQRPLRWSMYAMAVAFAAATVLSLADPAALPLPRDAGGVVRSAALGLVLVVGVLARKPRRASTVGSA